MKFLARKHVNLISNKAGNFDFAKIKFGSYGLQALESGILTASQLEITRRVITRLTKRRVKLWVRTKINTPITAKPREIRMGKGKGEISQYVRYITRGEIILELALNPVGKIILEAAKKKLPVLTRIVTRKP